MIRPFQLGRSRRPECEEELPLLLEALNIATYFSMSTKLNNLLKIQPKLREVVRDRLNTSLEGSIYSVQTSANGSNPSREFELTLNKSISTIDKIWAICGAVAEIELHAKGMLHFREYSDGMTRFSWVPDKTKHTLDDIRKPWKTPILYRAKEIFEEISKKLLTCNIPNTMTNPKRLVLRDYLVDMTAHELSGSWGKGAII